MKSALSATQKRWKDNVKDEKSVFQMHICILLHDTNIRSNYHRNGYHAKKSLRAAYVKTGHWQYEKKHNIFSRIQSYSQIFFTFLLQIQYTKLQLL